MPNVKANSPIVHNGVRYEEGDVIADLTTAQARQLIDSGAASKDTEGGKPAAGKPVAKSTTSAASNVVKGGNTPRKTAVEKAQEREQAQAAKAAAANGGEPAKEPGTGESTATSEPVQLPESFTTAEGEYTTKLNKNGKVSGYLFNGEPVKRADYEAAFTASNTSTGGEDDQPTE